MIRRRRNQKKSWFFSFPEKRGGGFYRCGRLRKYLYFLKCQRSVFSSWFSWVAGIPDKYSQAEVSSQHTSTFDSTPAPISLIIPLRCKPRLVDLTLDYQNPSLGPCCTAVLNASAVEEKGYQLVLLRIILYHARSWLGRRRMVGGRGLPY